MPSSSYSSLALCHGVYIAEFDQLKGPLVLLERPKCFENAKFQQIVAGLPQNSITNNQPRRTLSNNSSMSFQSESPSPSTLATASIFEAQGRLLETADRIARRLLAGSVGEGNDFLEEVEDDEDEEGERNNNNNNNNNKECRHKLDAIREKRHHLFSSFLDAVPVSKRTGTAAAMYGAALHHQQQSGGGADYTNTLSNNSFSSTVGGGGIVPSPSSVISSPHTGGNNNNNNNNNSSLQRSTRVFVQNDAALEMCVVCACTFAIPDVYARGYRRDVVIFAICPRLGWQKIAPRVSESLRLFGSRMCDNSMVKFLHDLAKVSGALSRVYHKLQLQVKKDKEEQEALEKKRKEEEARSNTNNTKEAQEQSGNTNNSPKTPPSKPSYHFKLRRTEEEFNSISSLAESMKVTPSSNPLMMMSNNNNNDAKDSNALTSEKLELLNVEEDDKIANRCRTRGQDALRGIGELCPLVWEEDEPTEDVRTMSAATLGEKEKIPNAASSSSDDAASSSRFSFSQRLPSGQSNQFVPKQEDDVADDGSGDQQGAPPTTSITQPNLLVSSSSTSNNEANKPTKHVHLDVMITNNNSLASVGTPASSSTNNNTVNNNSLPRQASHGHFPSTPKALVHRSASGLKKPSTKTKTSSSSSIDHTKIKPAAPYGEKHWEAAHTLLAKFTPLIMGTIHQELQQQQQLRNYQQRIAEGVVGNRTPMMTMTTASTTPTNASSSSSSMPQSPTIGVHNNNVNFSVSSQQSSIAPTTIPATTAMQNNNNNAAQQQVYYQQSLPPQSLNLIQVYNFAGGKYHETKWNLRGYVYCPFSNSVQSNTNNNNNIFNSSTSVITRSTSSVANRQLTQKEQHFFLVNSMRKVLPSVFVPSHETFPPIVVNSKRKRNQQQQQQQQASNNNNNSNKPLEIPSRLRQQQEKVSAQFNSDAAGQFYRKYKNGVKGIKNDSARQNVLPTIALFPSFCERKS